MTLRQNILKSTYPVLMEMNRLTGSHRNIFRNKSGIKPDESFYKLKAINNSGKEIDFSEFKEKKVLIVNTASDCGYTAQYEDLQKLYKIYENKLIILAFPSNDYGEQEKGTDEEIGQFCKINYEVTFPVIKKSVLMKKPGQHEVYKWLTNPDKNGWNNYQPDWNFCKYLVNEEGVLTHCFESAVSPFDNEIIEALL